MINTVQFPGLGIEMEINRVAFSIGPINIYWYGVLIGAGLLVALLFTFKYAAEFGINQDRMIDVIILTTICAVICARLYYVAFAPFKYDNLWDIINTRDGGLAIYGAIIGAFLFGILFCKWRKVPTLPMFDLAAMGFLIGQSIGRWGNFANQEAFGTNTTLPWGMKSEATVAYLTSVQATLAAEGVVVNPELPVHPTFLYESLWCALGFVLLFLYMKKRRFNGEIILMYIMWYGIGRFFIEGLRTDSLMIASLGIRTSQLVAVVSVVAALGAWVVCRQKGLSRDKSAYAVEDAAETQEPIAETQASTAEAQAQTEEIQASNEQAQASTEEIKDNTQNNITKAEETNSQTAGDENGTNN